MAISRIKVWSSGEVLTSADLNGEINNIILAGTDLVFPAGKAFGMAGFAINLDPLGTSSISASVNGRIDLALAGTTLFRFNTVASAVNGIDLTASATLNPVTVAPFGSDTDIGWNLNAKGAGRVNVANSPTGIPENVAFAASIGASALTISLKGINGNDPSAINPVKVPFRNVTVATGDLTILSITSATSLVVPSTATLGTSNNTAFRLWIVGFNDAATFRLGVINCLSGGSVYPLSGFGIASSTLIAAASNSAQVFYTGTAVTSKAYALLGYVTYESGLATAGTWSATPTRIQPIQVGTALPGSIVQIASNATGAVGSGSTLIPFDDTIPQITEGNEYMTQAITPSSTASLLRITASAFLASSAAAQSLTMALFQDATANALAAVQDTTYGANGSLTSVLRHSMLAGIASSTTFRIRAGGSQAGTTTFNGFNAARIYGGVSASYLQIEEIMT